MYTLLSNLQFIFLKTFYRIDTLAAASENRLKLEDIFFNGFPQKVINKFVVDFGCGKGADTELMAVWGAKLAFGLDIREELILDNSKKIIHENCQFGATLPHELKNTADLIISIDAFEHFNNPSEILKIMYECLRPGGEALISFGPTWYHPYGGHSFSFFPWSHLLFTENALIRWRNLFYFDGAQRFSEVAGGLNGLSIAEFERIFQQSEFHIEKLYCKPIRGKPLLQKILGRELATSMVVAHLKKP